MDKTSNIIPLSFFKTKRLYHIISPAWLRGVDLPPEISMKPEALSTYMEPAEGRAFCFATAREVVGTERFVTYSLVYTKDEAGVGVRGWNIIRDRTNKGEIEVHYIRSDDSPEMYFDRIVFAAMTEVPIEATDPNISEDLLMRLLRPTFVYLEETMQHLKEARALQLS